MQSLPIDVITHIVSFLNARGRARLWKAGIRASPELPWWFDDHDEWYLKQPLRIPQTKAVVHVHCERLDNVFMKGETTFAFDWSFQITILEVPETVIYTDHYALLHSLFPSIQDQGRPSVLRFTYKHHSYKQHNADPEKEFLQISLLENDPWRPPYITPATEILFHREDWTFTHCPLRNYVSFSDPPTPAPTIPSNITDLKLLLSNKLPASTFSVLRTIELAYVNCDLSLDCFPTLQNVQITACTLVRIGKLTRLSQLIIDQLGYISHSLHVQHFAYLDKGFIDPLPLCEATVTVEEAELFDVIHPHTLFTIHPPRTLILHYSILPPEPWMEFVEILRWPYNNAFPRAFLHPTPCLREVDFSERRDAPMKPYELHWLQNHRTLEVLRISHHWKTSLQNLRTFVQIVYV